MYHLYIYHQSSIVFFPQFIMRPLSKATITTIVSLLTTGHFYASIKAQTGASVGAITKIHQDHCSEVAVSSGGHPKKADNCQYHLRQALNSYQQNQKCGTSIEIPFHSQQYYCLCSNSIQGSQVN